LNYFSEKDIDPPLNLRDLWDGIGFGAINNL